MAARDTSRIWHWQQSPKQTLGLSQGSIRQWVAERLRGLMIYFQFVFGMSVREEKKERESEEEEEEGVETEAQLCAWSQRKGEGRVPKLTLSPSRGKQG